VTDFLISKCSSYFSINSTYNLESSNCTAESIAPVCYSVPRLSSGANLFFSDLPIFNFPDELYLTFRINDDAPLTVSGAMSFTSTGISYVIPTTNLDLTNATQIILESAPNDYFVKLGIADPVVLSNTTYFSLSIFSCSQDYCHSSDSDSGCDHCTAEPFFMSSSFALVGRSPDSDTGSDQGGAASTTHAISFMTLVSLVVVCFMQSLLFL